MNKVALLGYGVVGKGVKALLETPKLKNDFLLTKIFDRPIYKDELKDLLVTDYMEIINDKEIKIVFEALGGDILPYEIIKECLNSSKSIITSNKETVSKHLDEYLDLAKKNNVKFLFEASVGGGIPLLCNIVDLVKTDTITSFIGILNGTSNYILTKIFKDGISFNDALKEAQEKGYAELDPSDDLNGIDLLRKGVILSSLSYNLKVDYKRIEHFGISKLNDEIISKIKEMNKVLKLVVRSSFINNKFNLIVEPVLLNKDHLLSNTDYAFNNVLINLINNNTLSFYGMGAGSIPTASAMINDGIRIINNNGIVNRLNAVYKDIEFDINNKYLVYKNNKFEIININNVESLKNYDFIALII